MSVSASDFIPLTPVTFDPYFVQSVAHAVVIIDGAHYLPSTFSVTENAHGATDEASFALSLSNNPDFSLKLYRGVGISQQLPNGQIFDPRSTNLTQAQQAQVNASTPNVPVFVEIWAGLLDTPRQSTDLSGLLRQFYGIIDAYTITPDSDEVTFTCRSLAAPFIDQKITTIALNQTSIQLVTAMANSIGLKTNIALPDGPKPITVQETLGREFIGGPNFKAAVYNMHPWDLFLQMAQFDSVDVWVRDDTLNYIAPSKVVRTKVNLVYGGDGQSPGIQNPIGTHSIQFNKNIRVEVRSYIRHKKTSTVYRADSNDGPNPTMSSNTKIVTSSPVFGTSASISQSISASGVPSTTISDGSGGGFAGTTSTASESGKMIYKIYHPNLTPDRCNQLAQALWRQYSSQEFGLSFDLPVTKARLTDFSITSLLHISGLPYDSFNTHDSSDVYYPRQIVQTFDTSSGWKWSVHAVNIPLPQGAV